MARRGWRRVAVVETATIRIRVSSTRPSASRVGRRGPGRGTTSNGVANAAGAAGAAGSSMEGVGGIDNTMVVALQREDQEVRVR